jgi:hypothetical protein
MREICIEEHVILVEKTLYLFIHLIKSIKFMIKKNGGVISGILWIMVLILTLEKVFLNSLKN